MFGKIFVKKHDLVLVLRIKRFEYKKWYTPFENNLILDILNLLEIVNNNLTPLCKIEGNLQFNVT